MKRFIAFSVFALLLIGVGVFLYTSQSDAQTKPNKPVITSLVPVSACRINVNFTESSVANSFNRRVSSNSATPISGLSCSSPTCTLVHPITGLAKNTSYTVSLQAVSDYGSSDWSDQKTTTTINTVAPAAPQGLQHSGWTNSRTHIQWTAPSGMTAGYSGYRVYEAKDGTSNITPVSVLTGTSYDAIVNPNEPYYFNVKAYEAGDSCRIDDITTTYDGIAAFSSLSTQLIIPAVPKNITEDITAVGSDWKIKLGWDASAEATKYKIELSYNASFSPIFETNTGTDTNYNSSNSFPSDRVIYYRIQAIYEKSGIIGTSDYATGSITTGIPAPTDFSVTHSFDPISGTPSPIPLKFTWTDNASNFPRDIVIQKSTDNWVTYTELGRHTVAEIGDVPEFNISVPEGNVYLFRAFVEDKNSKKVSVFSNQASANLVKIVKKFTLDGEGWMQTGGWLKFESVYITNDNKVRGHAWNPSFGWLDFDAVDSVKCPGNVCATYDEATGQISGWAQFKFADQSVPGWDGWVNLRGATQDGSFKYGLCFGNSKTQSISYINPVTGVTTYYQTGETCEKNGSATNNKVKGIVWGGPVVGGWIVFEDVAPVPLSIEKRPISVRYAPREHVTVWTSNGQNADWTGVLTSGSGSWGSISPNTNIATTTFIAPKSGNKISKILASTTAGTASTTLTIAENPYIISCTSQKGSIRVDWTKEWADSGYPSYAPHTLSLTYSTSSATGPWKTLSPNPNPLALNSGSYKHDSLSTSTTYYYKLSAQFPDVPTPQTYDVITTTGCMASAPVVDNPSRLRVYAQDMKTLLLNWKDNSTSSENYKFQVERIKLTPASSTNFGVTTSQALVTSQSVPLTWKNITTSTPFYMWIERSSTTDAGTRFANPNKKDPTYPGCSTANGGDPVCGINKTLGVFRPVVVTTTNPKTFTGKLDAFYDSDVIGRNGEGTTFFYRIRACSSIDPKYTECTGSECIVNNDYRPIPACSPFTATSTTGKLIATTTPPLPVIEATTTPPTKVNKNDPMSLYKVTVQWKDDSLRETGVLVQRDGLTAIRSVGGKISFASRNIYKNPLDADVAKFGPYGGRGSVDSFVDETLEPGTYYTYKIIPYYETTDPITGQFVRALSLNESTTVGANTPYRVIISVGGDGSSYGYVTENTKNLDTRTASTTADFWPDEQAQVEYHYSASPIDSDNYAFFFEWSGVSGCTTQQSCYTQRSGTVYASAEFRRYCYDFNVNVSPSFCATPVVTGTDCQTPHKGGMFERETSADADYKDVYSNATTTCVFDRWIGSPNVTLYSDRSATARFTTTTTIINLDVPHIPIFASIKNKFADWRNVIGGVFADEKVSAGQIKSRLTTAPVTSFTANAYDAISSFVGELKRMVGGIFSASAATPNADEDYFVKVNINPISQPSYKDENLEPDTVYYYRVGIKYPSDAQIKKWSMNDGSGKTLPSGSVNSGSKSPACVRNSYCDFTLPRWDAPPVTGLSKERSEQQCVDNGDCVNVGRKRQTTEEQ